MSQQTGARGQLETLLVHRCVYIIHARGRIHIGGTHREALDTTKIEIRKYYARFALGRDKPFARFLFPANKLR